MTLLLVTLLGLLACGCAAHAQPHVLWLCGDVIQAVPCCRDVLMFDPFTGDVYYLSECRQQPKPRPPGGAV